MTDGNRHLKLCYESGVGVRILAGIRRVRWACRPPRVARGRPATAARVLLNLISNGFYAARKRKTEANKGDYEPMFAAGTKNLRNCVQIKIRDNGAGISPRSRKK
jgi:signal transduction histidine kinase